MSMDPSSPSCQSRNDVEAQHRRWWEGWLHPKPVIIPSRARLSESPPVWIWVQAVGVALLAAVHVVTCLSEGVLGLPPLRVWDPERLFETMTICYAAGGWLLS